MVLHLFSEPDWYLSSNGSDTSTCGRNISTACRTLDWLLDRFHNTSYWTNKTFSLGTDISLTINKHLVVRPGISFLGQVLAFSFMAIEQGFQIANLNTCQGSPRDQVK